LQYLLVYELPFTGLTLPQFKQVKHPFIIVFLVEHF